VIDSSIIRPTQLQSYVKSFIDSPGDPLTLVFESFAFKRGVPNDADFVFDVRMLPNPHYEPGLRDLTGCDAPVVDFLQQQADVQAMLTQIHAFMDHWLDAMARNHRSYVTVAIGCTGPAPLGLSGGAVERPVCAALEYPQATPRNRCAPDILISWGQSTSLREWSDPQGIKLVGVRAGRYASGLTRKIFQLPAFF
jgi:hypothetical protein